MSPIVMLHGWGTSAAIFDALREQLDWCPVVGALDLPGYGTSSTCEPYTLETIAARFSAVAPSRCCIIGWSLGAQVALTWARAQPDQIEALALIAATPCFVQRDDWACAMERGVFDQFSTALEDDPAATLARFCALQAHGERDARSTTQQLRAALDTRAVPPTHILASGLRVLLESDLRAHLHAVVQPALVVHGECDQLVPAAAADYLARALPHGRLELMPGVAHAPFISAPRRVSALVQEFFQ